MVYKRYIKRGGKIYGPYYYESYKKDGKVISKYIGGPEINKKNFNFNKILLPFILIIFLGILSVFLINPNFTGAVTLHMKNISSIALGEKLELSLEKINFNAFSEKNKNNYSIKTNEYDIIINQPIKIKKTIENSENNNVFLDLPKNAQNIVVKKIEKLNINNSIIEQKKIINKNDIFISEINSEKKDFNLLNNFFQGLSKITGFSVQQESDSLRVNIKNDSENLEIEYEIPGPKSIEKNIDKGKQIKVISDKHYENVLAFTNIQGIPGKIPKIYWLEEDKYIPSNYKENNGDYYIEWIIPHLSNQTFIIEITKAEHLDNNKNFVKDVYEYVNKKDKDFVLIPNNNYLRVKFEKQLDNKKDITIYAKTEDNSNTNIEIYEFNSSKKIAEFTNVNEYKKYKILLNNLSNSFSQDVFDLKIVNDNNKGVEFDYVIDPSGPEINISYPVDYGTHLSPVSTINYTVSSDGENCWYSTDWGKSNSSAVSAGTNFSVDFKTRNYNLTIYCDDSSSNIGKANISFFSGNVNKVDEINKLLASDGAGSDEFGYSVSISGDYAIIGSRLDDDNGANSGSAYIFKKNSTGQYEEVNKLLASDGAAGAYFGHSVSISGDYAIIGASGNDEPTDDEGAAYIFKKNSTGQFEEVNKLTASDGAADDSFGYSVSISDYYVIIGSLYDNVGQGSAYIFKKNSTGQYEEVNKLLASDGVDWDAFGCSVSISGDYAIIGAYGKDSSQGATYIFKKNSTGQFEEVNKITSSDGAASDYFGYSVSISGNYAIIGAKYEDGNGDNSGSAYIFKKNSTGQYEEVNKITSSDGAAGDYFGHSVSISGDYAIIGAYYSHQPSDDEGAAYIFKKNSTGQYEEVNKITSSDGAADDWFGYALSLSGDYAIIGAKYEDGNGDNSGSAYAFQLKEIPIPEINISYPVDYGGYVPSVETINYTVIDGEKCWYSTDWGETNSSAVLAGTNFSVSFDSGNYNLTVYCNNSVSEIGKNNISFVVGDFDNATEINKLLASDGAGSDYFGDSVSISGEYTIIGADGDNNDNGDNAGAAYIFKKNSTGQFEEVNKLLASDGEGGDLFNDGDRFGNSVSISGDYAIVGSHLADGSSAFDADQGAAYIFKKNSTGQFEEVNKFTASDADGSEEFGYSVSISGDYAIIGNDVQKVYIFKKNSTGQFEEVNKFTASDVAVSDYFGRSVSISGDYAIIGADGDDDDGSASGSAYIFKKNSTGQYEEVNKITASDAAGGDYFGESVSISGDYAIVGAHFEDDNGDNAGAAYIFKKNSTGQYEEVNKITASDAAGGDYFGESVSISGDYAIVGALYDDDDGASSGSSYIFKKNSTGQFEELIKLTASDGEGSDYFGDSVSISGDYAIIGAYGDDDSGSGGGSAYIFNLIEMVSVSGPPGPNKFDIKNITGGTVALIDNKGDMYLKGSKNENQGSLSPGANSFVLQNNSGTIISYISSIGDLYLKGSVETDSDLTGMTSSNLEIRNVTNTLVGFFDNIGNLKLKGGIEENSDQI